MKPLGAVWMVATYEYIKGKPDIIKNRFEAAGIVDQKILSDCGFMISYNYLAMPYGAKF